MVSSLFWSLVDLEGIFINFFALRDFSLAPEEVRGICEVRAESVNAFLATLDCSASAIVSENPQLNGMASSEFAGRLSMQAVNELFSCFDCRFP